LDLSYFQEFAGDYAWDQVPPVPPAQSVSETVYDSLGNAHQITVQFYQVNDLGTAGINNPSGPNQVCYAWYAFDTTGGKTVSTANLLGGTGIYEGNILEYNRGNPEYVGYGGDFLWFNTDGSLASSGGVSGLPGPPGLAFNFMITPRVYIPPSNLPPPTSYVSPIPTEGAQILSVSLDFGTYGLLGTGERDGVYSDAEGSYKMVNGVNTYIPQDTVYASSQNGYPDGVLQGLNVEPSGIIEGSFSNGQKISLAQVALEQVQNPDGLSQAGDNYFAQTANSGSAQVGLPGQGNFGTTQSGTLEGSNVNLATELTSMIIAERSYDTNARMIAVENEQLDTLTQLGEGG
jgi:flagellar hook-basal body protein